MAMDGRGVGGVGLAALDHSGRVLEGHAHICTRSMYSNAPKELNLLQLTRADAKIPEPESHSGKPSRTPNPQQVTFSGSTSSMVASGYVDLGALACGNASSCFVQGHRNLTKGPITCPGGTGFQAVDIREGCSSAALGKTYWSTYPTSAF